MKNTLYKTLAPALIIAMISLAHIQEAQANDKETAYKHFEAALLLTETGNFERAAEEFIASIDLYPTKNGYFNLAQCYVELRRFNEAKETVRQLRETFGDSLNRKWETQIRNFEEELQEMVIELDIKINIDGAAIQVDGNPVGESPLVEPVLVGAGDHEVVVSKEEHDTVTETITLEQGQGTAVMHLNLQRTPPPEQSETTHPVLFSDDDAGPKKRKRVWTWVSYGVGGLTGIAAIITGSIHLNRVSQLEEECPDYVCNRIWEDDIEKTKRLGVATNVLIGVSATALITGTILFFVEGKDESSSTHVSVAPIVAPETMGLSLSKSF